jgi:hypothetical protein
MMLSFPCTCGQSLKMDTPVFGDAERQLVAAFLLAHIFCKSGSMWRALNTLYSHWGKTGEMLTLVTDPDSSSLMRLISESGAPNPEHKLACQYCGRHF